jgi:hypothetical protein
MLQSSCRGEGRRHEGSREGEGASWLHVPPLPRPHLSLSLSLFCLLLSSLSSMPVFSSAMHAGAFATASPPPAPSSSPSGSSSWQRASNRARRHQGQRSSSPCLTGATPRLPHRCRGGLLVLIEGGKRERERAGREREWGSLLFFPLRLSQLFSHTRSPDPTRPCALTHNTLPPFSGSGLERKDAPRKTCRATAACMEATLTTATMTMAVRWPCAMTTMAWATSKTAWTAAGWLPRMCLLP